MKVIGSSIVQLLGGKHLPKHVINVAQSQYSYSSFSIITCFFPSITVSAKILDFARKFLFEKSSKAFFASDSIQSPKLPKVLLNLKNLDLQTEVFPVLQISVVTPNSKLKILNFYRTVGFRNNMFYSL